MSLPRNVLISGKKLGERKNMDMISFYGQSALKFGRSATALKISFLHCKNVFPSAVKSLSPLYRAEESLPCPHFSVSSLIPTFHPRDVLYGRPLLRIKCYAGLHVFSFSLVKVDCTVKAMGWLIGTLLML